MNGRFTAGDGQLCAKSEIRGFNSALETPAQMAGPHYQFEQHHWYGARGIRRLGAKCKAPVATEPPDPVAPNAATEGVMPFKSQAQRRKFAQLLVEGKISNQTFEEWNRETGRKRLPERVGSKARPSKARSPSKRVARKAR